MRVSGIRQVSKSEEGALDSLERQLIDRDVSAGNTSSNRSLAPDASATAGSQSAAAAVQASVAAAGGARHARAVGREESRTGGNPNGSVLPASVPAAVRVRVLQELPGWAAAAAAVEGLRYRAEDCAAKITKRAVREARAKELRLEILNSEKWVSSFLAHVCRRSASPLIHSSAVRDERQRIGVCNRSLIFGTINWRPGPYILQYM